MAIKKILFIVPEFPSVSETFILNQIISLINMGHDVTIFSLGKPTDKLIHESVIQYNILDKVLYPSYVSFHQRLKLFVSAIFSKSRLKVLKSVNFLKYGSSAIRLTNFCKLYPFLQLNEHFDVVHIHFGQMLDNFLLLRDVGAVIPQKVVLTFHGYDLAPEDIEKNRLRYSSLLKQDIHATVNTPYLESILNTTLPSFRNYDILPVGLDTSYFRPATKKSQDLKKVNIVFCGRFVKFKGVARLPAIINKTIAQDNGKDIVFHIIGDGDQDLKTNFLKSTEELQKHGFVKYYGSLSQGEIIEVLDISDIFILPGIYDNQRAETQGLVIQEAQSMGLAVVVTDAGGMKYGVQDGETGFVVDYRSDDLFVEKLLYLVENDKVRTKMGQNARAFAVANYDNEILLKKLSFIYNF